MSYARGRQADMPGVDLLDENHVPLLIDRFPFDERYQSFQLYQRGVRWKSLESSLEGAFKHPAKDLLDEWITGFSIGSSINEQTERELIAKLKDPQIHYLDYFTGDYDHTAHLTSDRVSQFHVIEALDSLVGRIWSAIETSPLASTTMVVMVSDHGMNTDSGVYSQGYSLIDWFNSAEGGGHHVLSNRHPMTEFKLKGLDPFVSEVTSPSSESSYLAGQAREYPTAVLDLDGNERASISLRNNSLNVIQILLDELAHKKPTGRVRHAVIEELFATLNRARPVWQRNVNDLTGELNELHTRIERQQAGVNAQPRKWTVEQRNSGLDQEAKRQIDRLERMRTEERGYADYVAAMKRLLALDPADFDPGKFNTADLIPHRSLGDPNSIRDLQHYVVGPSPAGMVVCDDGTLDRERSFQHIDYFSKLSAIQVRNNVQKDVGPRPVDFIAVGLKDSVWLWRGPERQALISTRRGASGEMELRYTPVAHLTQDESGELHYDRAEWAAGFPLELFEDPKLAVSRAWLNDWHTEREWLNAVHRTKYSNGIIGAVEALLSEPVADPYLERKRELRRVDMIAFANDHWNFNVRGFNPGGNHGSFLQVSTHSVLLFAGGGETGIPRGLRVETPYDSLSFVPTILTLMGKREPALPGPVIREMIDRR